ncbi:MAG: argininosuccinate lyase, partial [Candidatus Marinimicrobia bacterium]|nr:argininosuccinate lyase [Candidatus Neomarinimicrobiota bacterium]
MKLWSPKGGVNKQIEEFTVGNDYLIDRALVKYDAVASKVHARMLGKIGILSDNEVTKLTDELDTIIQLAEDDSFEIQPEQEDCHTAIEEHLTAKLGDLGKKIHTARSRNDQVLAALRLYYKDQLDAMASLAQEFIRSVSAFTVEHGDVEFPGYTHTRKAMPASVNMWGSAFVQSMQDNFTLIRSAKQLTDQSPLGTGAGYGVPLDVDREFTSEELGFDRVQQSPIYVQNSRGKFEAHILHVCSQVMLDLNRLATDLIFFSMPGIGYFDLPDEFCTGSSIMPQK